MNEVALFETALRAAAPAQPDPRLGRDLVPRLAQTARAATIEAETRAGTRGTASGGRRRARSRLALVARVCIAVGLIPLVLAGLAFAGVTVPGPARDAFDSLGIALPNQPSEQDEKPTGQSQGGGNDVSDAAKGAKDSEQGNSAAAHSHAREQRNKAKGKGKAFGHTRGKAIGLNDLAPPGQSGDTGPPEHSNEGGSAQSQSSHAAPRAQSRPFPPVSSRGR
jgi:hypothetical protein